MAIKFPTPAQISLGATAAAIIGVFALPYLVGTTPPLQASKADKFLRDCTTWPGSLADCNILLKSKEATPEQKERAAAKAETLRARKEQEDASLAKKRAAEAKFKAEGWRERKPGIFVRWCEDKNPCPGPSSNGYSDYTWRYMVWCKERACGNIYARLNITKGGAIVEWTNDTAYADYGQKVVLTFGSRMNGSGQVVEFKTY